MARSRSDYSPDKASDNDSAQNRLDAAEKRRQKKQARKTTVDPKPSVAFGSVLPSVDSPVTIVEPQATVFEPTASRSPLDDAEAEHVGIGQESVDESLERKSLRFLLPESLPDEDESSYNREELISRLLKELKRFDADEESQRPGWKKFSLKEKVLDLLESRRWNNKKSVQGKLLKEMKGTRDGNSTKDSEEKAASVSFAQEENLQEDVPREGHFGSPDYKEAIDDQADQGKSREEKKSSDVDWGLVQKDFDKETARRKREASLREDDITEGLGVVREKAPEVVMEEGRERKVHDIVSEKIGSAEEEENVLEGEYLPDGEESLQELRDRVKTLKGSSDEARNRFLTLRHRNTSKWLAVKKALFSSRPKELPESLVDEMEVLKSDWKYALTLYKDAVVELVKREAMERKLDGKAQGALMAEAIRGLDVQGSIENYDAWKNASWGDRKDSNFLRVLGRARDWAEEYRKLDWKKRVAISAVVVGTAVAGVAVGSAGLVGVGVAGSTIVRLLGAYGAGRGSYEFLEGRANQKTLQYHEAALSNVEKIEDIGFLERRMKTYADRVQKDLDRAIAGNRKRVAASVALGSMLFLGGTAFAHRGAIQEFSGKVSKGFSEFLEQMKIITGIEDFRAAPVSIGGASVDQAVEVAGAANLPAPEAVSSPISTPSSPEPIAPISLVEPGRLASGDAGVGIADGGQAAEVAGKIAKNLSETISVSKGSSVWETVRNYVMEHGGASNPDETEKMTARIVNNFVNTNKEGLTLQDISLVQPETRLEIISNPDNPRIPFKISSVEFAPVQGFSYAETPTIRVPSLPDVVEKIISPSSETIASPNANIFGGDLWRGADIPTSQPTTIEPSDIFEKGVPEVVSAPSAHSPVPDFETLDLAVPGNEYFNTVRTVVETQLGGYPLSEKDKNLIESIFTIRVPVGSEPTKSALFLAKERLANAIFPPGSVERLSQEELTDEVKRKVNVAVYAALKRIGGEALNVRNMATTGITVNGWLEKMARYILTHPIEIKK